MRLVGIAFVLLISGATPSAFAQQEGHSGQGGLAPSDAGAVSERLTGIDEGGQAQTGAQDTSAPGMLPLPQYSGDWISRRYLAGELGGLRSEWAEKGIFFSVEWYQAGQGVVSGGTRERWAYGTNLDYDLQIDLMRMGVLPGALLTVRGQSRFGSTVNGDTGLLLPVNTYSYFPYTDPIGEDVPIAITELNYLQFLTDEIGVLVGKVTTMENSNEFAGGQGRSQFMNFQFIFPSVFAQVAPYSTLAVGGVWMPLPRLTLTSLLINTEDASTTTGFSDIGEGTTWWTSLDYQVDLGGQPGGGTVGFAYAFDGDFARIGGLNLSAGPGDARERKAESWALYWSAWQYLFTDGEVPTILEAGDGRQDVEGLGVFAVVGLADADTNPVSWSIAGGLGGRGTLPTRVDDTWGVGYFYNGLQEPRRRIVGRRLQNSNQGFEAYYNVALLGSVDLTLDIQWAKSAFSGIEDSVIPGVRLNVRL